MAFCSSLRSGDYLVMKTRKFGSGHHLGGEPVNNGVSFNPRISPEQRELVAENVLRDYRGLYNDVERALALISDNPKKRHIVKVWKEAHDSLTKLNPLLRIDHDIPE